MGALCDADWWLLQAGDLRTVIGSAWSDGDDRKVVVIGGYAWIALLAR